jgi:hypothetical protein
MANNGEGHAEQTTNNCCTMKSNPNDEEISTLLRHFRSRPRFAISSPCGSGTLPSTSGPRRHVPKQRFRQCDRGYTSVKYAALEDKIVLTYLHVQHNSDACPICVYLTFEMSVSTKVVKCIHCSAPNKSISDLIQSKMDVICDHRLSETNTESDVASLFSIASRLLQMLNCEIPTIDIITHSYDKGETYHGLVKRSIRLATPIHSHVNSGHLLIDLQTLLMRCAAAGRTRSHILSPVPVEFASMTNKGRDCDALAHLVFNASNELYMCGFRGVTMQQQTSDAWALLSFILSLPMIDSRLSKSSASNDTTSMKSVAGRLSLELNTINIDPPPSFTKLANKYGTIQVYHGTKIASTWSILNHGLQNLSNNKALSQNGAIMGEGVYLSSSRKVAENFAIMAAERPPKPLALALEHESLLYLLYFANINVAKLDPLNTYDIKCLPVFEAAIIKPPAKEMGYNEFDERITHQEGKYFVCADSEFVWITKLHLTFELTNKVDVWRWLPAVPFSLLVFLVALVGILLASVF